MPHTRQSTDPELILGGTRDRLYPLIISDHPETQQFIRAIPLQNIRWETLKELADPDADNTVMRAMLIPSHAGRTITVMVGEMVVGSLPDPTVVTDSQIARVYASGYIPTCKLVITPDAGVLAHIHLYITDGGVPHNTPPLNPWALLPAGNLWSVEPTRLSPFEEIRDQSRVLVELRAVGDMVFVHLNGAECGILAMDAADSLREAVNTAADHGLIAVAGGCLERRENGQVSLHIDARSFDNWSRADHHLVKNPHAPLVPRLDNPEGYREEMLRFIHDHEVSREPLGARLRSAENGITRLGPVLLLLGAALVMTPIFTFDYISARGLVGIFGMSAMLAVLSLWVFGCRQRDTDTHRQPRHWNTLAPLTLTALIPSTVFATVGIIIDTGPDSSTAATSARMTTLQTFPAGDGQLSAFLESGGLIPQSAPYPPRRVPGPRFPVGKTPEVSPRIAATPRVPGEPAPAQVPADAVFASQPQPTLEPHIPQPQNDSQVSRPPVPDLPSPRDPEIPPYVPIVPPAPTIPPREDIAREPVEEEVPLIPPAPEVPVEVPEPTETETEVGTPPTEQQTPEEPTAGPTVEETPDPPREDSGQTEVTATTGVTGNMDLSPPPDQS